MTKFSDLRLALTFASVLAGVLLLQTLLTTAAIFGLAISRFPGAWALWQASALFNSVDRAAGAMGYGDGLAHDLQKTRRYLRRNKSAQLVDLRELLQTMQEAISDYETEMGFGNV